MTPLNQPKRLQDSELGQMYIKRTCSLELHGRYPLEKNSESEYKGSNEKFLHKTASEAIKRKYGEKGSR